jgi:hypothetical protein
MSVGMSVGVGGTDVGGVGVGMSVGRGGTRVAICVRLGATQETVAMTSVKRTSHNFFTFLSFKMP